MMRFFSDWAQLAALICGIGVVGFGACSAYLQRNKQREADEEKKHTEQTAKDQRQKLESLIERNLELEEELAKPDLRISMDRFSKTDQVASIRVRNHGQSAVEKADLVVEYDGHKIGQNFMCRGLASGAETTWDVRVFDPLLGIPATGEQGKTLEELRNRVASGQETLTLILRCEYNWKDRDRTSLEYRLVIDKRIGARLYPGFPVQAALSK